MDPSTATADCIVTAIHAGQWHRALEQLNKLKPKSATLERFFNRILFEMEELQGCDEAAKQLRESSFLSHLSEASSTRFERRELQLSVPSRQDLAQEILLLSCADWEQGQVDSGLSKLVKKHTIDLPKSTAVTCSCMGHLHCILFVGCSDGLIEAFDCHTGKHSTKPSSQSSGVFMMHKAAVTALSLSLDGNILASGDAKGAIKIWETSTGNCTHIFRQAHQHAIRAIAFGEIGSGKVFSASTQERDGIRVHGMRSGMLLHVYHGLEGRVAQLNVSEEGAIYALGTDGMLAHWKVGHQVTVTHSFSDEESDAQAQFALTRYSVIKVSKGMLKTVLLGSTEKLTEMALKSTQKVTRISFDRYTGSIYCLCENGELVVCRQDGDVKTIGRLQSGHIHELHVSDTPNLVVAALSEDAVQIFAPSKEIKIETRPQ